MNQSRKAPRDVLLMNSISMLMLLLAVGVWLIAGVLWLMRQPMFDISRVVVEAAYMPHESAELLRGQIARIGNRNFFALNLQDAQQMLEQLPWVHQARVRREFPPCLHITLHEHVPEAFWYEHGADRGSELVSSAGRVFDPGPREKIGLDGQHLPGFHGPPGAARDMLLLYRTLAPVFDGLGRRMETLSVSTRDTWQTRLDNGVHIELGRGPRADILQRVRRFAATVPRVRAQSPCDWAANSIREVDLRHSGNRYALLCDPEDPPPLTDPSR